MVHLHTSIHSFSYGMSELVNQHQLKIHTPNSQECIQCVSGLMLHRMFYTMYKCIDVAQNVFTITYYTEFCDRQKHMLEFPLLV
jgi:hypothetical protein